MLNLDYTDYVIHTYYAYKNLNIKELYMNNKKRCPKGPYVYKNVVIACISEKLTNLHRN